MAQAVVGLGNPGAKYQGTRHNVGYQVLDRVAKRLQDEGSLLTGFRPVPGLGAIAEAIRGTDAVFLFRPARYMNESGRAVARFLREYERYGLTPAHLILVYDDIDLPVGAVRTRMKGSHGGHKGVASVMQSLGTQALRRVKVGVGRPSSKDEVVDHVLSRFSAEERSLIEAACAKAAEAVLRLLNADVSRPS